MLSAEMAAEQECTANGPRILVVGSELEVAGLEALLSDLDYVVCAVARSGREAISAVEAIPDGQPRPDLALIDLALAAPESGTAGGDRLRRRFGIPVIFVCDGDLPPCAVRGARIAEPAGYVPKPVARWHLRATIDTALAQHRRETKLAERARRLAREHAALRRRIATLQDRSAKTEATLRTQAKDSRSQAMLLSTVMNSMGEGLIVADRNGRYLMTNPAWSA